MLVSNFVSLASQKGDKRWLLDLLGIHQFAATHLETTSSISMRRVGTTHLSRPMRLWKNSEEQEIVLSSAQFLYAVSMLLHDAAAVDGVRGTEESERFLETYLDVVVRDHLFRWIWNRDADAGSFGGRWDCEPTTLYSHAEFVERLISNTTSSYCNAVSDSDLFVAMIALHIVALADANPDAFARHAPSVKSDDLFLLRSHVSRVWSLVMARTEFRTATSGDRQSQERAVFDPYGYDEFPDHRYAGYTGQAHPLASPVVPAMPATGAGWDISHGRRLVLLLDSFRRFANEGSLALAPADEVERFGIALANQLAGEVFVGSLEAPAFSNYLGGDDGWYRATSSGTRTLTGYSPSHWALGRSFLMGGYGQLARWNPELIPIWNAARIRELRGETPAWTGISRFESDFVQLASGEPAQDILQ
ncbi:MAG: hypothetical protein R3A78_01640 [Polyangiales bacterium]